jgi:LmbE family N-acetylglucosaminyl deacetylase
MNILYIYPHPDDESFGPAAVMAKHRRLGHDVHLLTLTKGGATKVRHDLGLSIAEMGEVRHKEMLDVEKTLGLSGMRVLDLPDSGLKEMDPRIIEKIVAEEIMRVRPNVLVSYPVHGISGFHDHLVAHAVVSGSSRHCAPISPGCSGLPCWP